jgi:sugar transferase (PEP-CTERM system associated)
MQILGSTLLDLPWLLWGALDVLIVTFCVYASYSLLLGSAGMSWYRLGLGQAALIQSGAFLLSGLIFGLYEQHTLVSRSRALTRSLVSALCAATLTSIMIHLLMYEMLSRRILLLTSALYIILGPSVRLLACWCVNTHTRRFVIVGTDRQSRLSLTRPDAHRCDGLSRRYHLVGYVSLDGVDLGRSIEGRPVLGTIDQIEQVCLKHGVHEVVVGPGPTKRAHVLDRMLGCLNLGCRVTDLTTFYEQVMSEVPLASLDPSWFLFADLKHSREARLILKRALDIAGALFGLVLTLPLWPVIALLVKLDSPGPVFYSQRRVGLNGKTFLLHKFRTMYAEAEKDGHQWASVDDPRVTPVGRYLRRSRLDELPQLWNVLRGRMSLVGPRPERPEFVDDLAPHIRFYNERHLIKPGLTGWAQINYRYGASIDDTRRKLQLDLWYMKHMSLELDLIVLLRTIGTVSVGAR